MSHQSDLIATDIDAYLEQHRTKELLRLLTCGSVDDGKSTLIGRLLHDSKLVYEDQLAAVKSDSAKHGTTEDGVDLALLVDGLKAEREQGITIDVAYRYFSTAKRKFIIADCPGHEQYTRNMATGASTCDLAIILVDARKGVLAQTRRHSFIVSLLGIKHVVVGINKMDLVDFDEAVFERIRQEYRDFASKLEVTDVSFIPISALEGDNVVDPSERMPWYRGSTIMHALENVHIASDTNMIDLRMPVQSVLRPSLDFRGFCGTIASGIVRKGDAIAVLPSGKESRVKSIVTYDGELAQAFAPQSVTLTLEDEIDISRGDMLVHPNNRPRTATDFEAMVVWMAEDALKPGKEYLIKQTTRTVTGRVAALRYGVDVNTMRRVELPHLELNQIGRCQIVTSQPLLHDPYRRNRHTGSFIFVDRINNNTVGAGMIVDRSPAQQSHWDAEAADSLQAAPSPVSQTERGDRFGQKPATLLLTGLTGSGKTTIAHALERRLFDEGRAVVVLDGQHMRSGLSKDLAFTPAERSESIRRFAEVAGLFNGAGLIVIGALVAPDDSVRQRAAKVVGSERFFVIHLDCPVQTCRERDMHGLYDRADVGEVQGFPGVSAPFDPPSDPALVLKTNEMSIEHCVDALVDLLERERFLRP